MNLNNQTNIKQHPTSIWYSKNENRLIVTVFVFGMAFNIASIFIGNPYIVPGMVVLIAVLSNIFRKKYQRPWIFLGTILAANPVNIDATIACNLVFPLCLLIYSIKCIRDLPNWAYLANAIAIISLICSSINWLFASATLGILSQISSAINYLFAPILFVPVIYIGMKENNNSSLNLVGLLFFLIIPSTIMLLLAYFFGSPVANVLGDIQTLVNLTIYKFGNTLFAFTRTQVGFIVASLICSSMAIIICRVGALNRLLAVICLVINSYLILVTGSVGSVIACLCGLIAIFLLSIFNISITKFLIVVTLIFSLFISVWNLSDTGVKKYIVERYEERFTKRGVNLRDRSVIWNLAIDYMKNNPEGVGWSLYIKEIRTYPHNDYFSYAIAYGIMGGLVYLGVIIKLGCSFFKTPKMKGEDPFVLAVRVSGLGIFVVLLINSLSDHLTANRWYFNVIWSFLWYAYYCNKNTFFKKGLNP